MKTKQYSLYFMIVVALLLFSACQTTTTETAATKTAIVSKAATQADADVVSAEGVVEPLDYVALSFQTGGEVAEILVEEGAQVNADDALIRLDSTNADLALAQAEARLASAQSGQAAAQKQLELAQASVDSAQGAVAAAEANLALTQAGPRPEEVAAAEANLAAAEAGVAQAANNRDVSLDIASDSDVFAAEANLASATAQYQALQDNYDAIIDACFTLPDGSEVCPLYGPVEESTRDQLEAARLNQEAAQEALNALREGATPAQQQAANGGVAVAIANRDAAQARLDLLLAGATPEQIAIAEIGVKQAQAGVTVAEAEVVRAEAAVTQAEAAVVQAEANVEAAQSALDRLTLKATFAGEVARINVTVGQLVGTGLPAAMLADFGGWQVKTTDLTELDVALVRVGAPVEVTLDAIPDETITGTVTKVALMSVLSRGDIVYETTISLDERPDLPIRWGMTAFVDIEASN